MAANVIVVDDEEHLREAVVEYLAEHGIATVGAANGAELRAMTERALPRVVVLDVAMPGEDGFALARWLRSFPEPPGLIFATAAGAPAERLGGLELGGDDYLVKPYELRELLARLRRVLARVRVPAAATRPAKPARPIVRIGRLSIDLERRIATDEAGQLAELTAGEFELLLALASRPNRVLSRDQLRELAEGRQGGSGPRGVDIRIARLRSKLDAMTGIPDLIRTVRGEGYMLASPSDTTPSGP